jgi:hypothetical protein
MVKRWLVKPLIWVQFPLSSKKPTWRNGRRGGLKIRFLSVQVRWWVILGRRQVERHWVLDPICKGSIPFVLKNFEGNIIQLVEWTAHNGFVVGSNPAIAKKGV